MSGFTVGGTGALTALAASPFSISGAGVERLATGGSDLFAVRGSAARLLSLETDAAGTVTENSGSPVTLGGPAFTVAAVGSVVVVGTTTAEALQVYAVSASGDLTEIPDSPVDAGAEILRVAFSD